MSFKAKVLDLSETVESSTGVNVRRASVSDDTANVILTLWARFTDVVEINQFYSFVGMRVKVAEDEFTLYTPKGNAEIHPIDDIGFVFPFPFFLSERLLLFKALKLLGSPVSLLTHFVPRANLATLRSLILLSHTPDAPHAAAFRTLTTVPMI